MACPRVDGMDTGPATQQKRTGYTKAKESDGGGSEVF
jgi:hypothetical protein